MKTNPLEAQVRHLPGMSIVDLQGDVDGDAESVLARAYAEAVRQGAMSIVLNFASTDYINSKGIALIVVLLRRAMAQGRRLLACGLSDHYREIMEVTRLSDYIRICAREDGAIAEVRPLVEAAAVASQERQTETH